MKKYFVVLAVLCTVGTSVAQAQMEKGSGLISAGLGLFDGWGINASYDHGLVDTWGPGLFTIGAYVGFQTWGDKITGTGLGDFRINKFAFAFRATYRYQINESFEVYGALMTGIHTTSYSEKWGGDNFTDLFWGGPIAGCRWSLSPNMSIFGEIGYSLSWLNGGLSFSF